MQELDAFEWLLQHIFVLLRDEGLWMRLEVLDTKTKTLTMNGAAYMVYYSGAPFVYIANLRPRYADYILQVCVLGNLLSFRVDRIPGWKLVLCDT